MVSVLPDGAEPRGSNGESCCSRTTVSWHPLTFRCRSPRHCICKHKRAPFTQLRQLREVIAFARPTVVKSFFYVVCPFFSRSSFNAPQCVNPQKQLLGAIIHCPCIPQGPPYFFSSSSGENSRNSVEKKHHNLTKITKKTQKNKSQKQGTSPRVTSPHLIAWLNSCRGDACWKVYRSLLNGPLSEMDEIQWWQINAASYLMAPHVNNSAHHEVHCLCDSSW